MIQNSRTVKGKEHHPAGAGSFPSLILPLLPQEEQRHGTGAGMGTDHRADRGDDHRLRPSGCLDHLSQGLGILQAIPVGDEHRGGLVCDGICIMLGQCLQGGLTPPDLGHTDQVALIVHMEHRLDL